MFDTVLYKPLGLLLYWIYQFVQNYGLAIIIFTILTKIILLPLGIKQQQSTIQMQMVKPELDEIQKKYKEKDKQSEETMKLYKKYGINPMAGCLPLVIQLPIIFALYRVITKPLTYIVATPDALKLAAENIKYGAEITAAKVAGFINFNFLGLDLSITPSFKQIGVIWIIPILAALTTYLSSKFMTVGVDKKDKVTTQKEIAGRPPRPGEKKDTANAMQSTSNSMMIMMPFVTLWFTFTMPAGISIYWIAGNVIQILQQFAMNKYLIPKIKERVAGVNDKSDRKVRENRG